MRVKVKLKSTASSYYRTTTKNKKNVTTKLKCKKYDPITRKYELFEEDKIK